ncbi:MAG: molybdopterin-dependent oxidoreductase [Candidatus Aminicenantes bacterium]|nr:molybdopterin-dependent oxidoreductase [Candidatus Aminicenantes bacterium]
MSYQTGVCNFCGTGCGHLMQVENGAVRGVFPSSTHPVGRGRLCVRGWHIHELLNTEERISRPQLRTDGALIPVFWDRALDEVALRLAGFSGGEIGFWASPRSSNEDIYSMVRLARAVFRSPNISLQSDAWYRSTVEVLREGSGRPGAYGSISDIRNADFILVVGTDLTRQNPIIASDIHFAARRGADVVTLSTRKTQMSRLSGTHLQNRPGTKKMVLAALAKVLLEADRGGASSAAVSIEGSDAFLKEMEGVNLDRIEQDCGLPLPTLRETALRLKAAPKAVFVFSTGISGLNRETVALIWNLFLVAGKAGRDGCAILPATGVSNLAGANDCGAGPGVLPGSGPLPDEAAAARFKGLWGAEAEIGPGRPVEDLLADASSKIKALVVCDHDPEINLYADRLKSLEYVVYLGSYANPFTDLAQAVLPTTTFVEADGTYTNTERRIQLNRRKVDPRFESRPAWEIFSALAARRGAFWPFRSSADVQEEITRAVPAYAGATHAALEAAFGGIQWPLGAERPFGPFRFVEAGLVSGPAPAGDEFPLRLMAGKSYYYWHQNNIMKKTFIPRREYNALLLLYPQGLVDVHPDDAAALGLRDKRPVRVVSARGAMTPLVRVTDEVPPGTVYAPYFVGAMIPDFLVPHAGAVERGEDAVIPVRLEKV